MFNRLDNIVEKYNELKDEERQPCEVWTRCMGYFRPFTFFNLGKKQEFKDRTYFKIKKALEHLEKSG